MTTKTFWNIATGEPAVFASDANVSDWPEYQEAKPVIAATEVEVRVMRDQLIAATDWWATSDRTMTAEQTAYRQALRDVPSQSGFPENVTWPQEPS